MPVSVGVVRVGRALLPMRSGGPLAVMHTLRHSGTSGLRNDRPSASPTSCDVVDIPFLSVNAALASSSPSCTRESSFSYQAISSQSKEKGMSASDCKGEGQFLELLQSLGIVLPTIEHEEKHTVEAANEELSRFGTPCIGAKNMFLKSKKDELVLVTALCTTKTDMKRVQKEAGTKDLRFAPAELLMEKLGVVQGSVTPFALVNNAERDVMVIIDKAVADCDVPFVLHPCRNDKSCLVTFAQLNTILEKLGYTYKIVDFSADNAASGTSSPVTTVGGGGGATAHAAAAPLSKAPAAQVAGETKLGIMTTREDNFSGWYTEVITKSEMIEYYDVSGCYIIRPWAHYVWKTIQRFLGDRIESMGVEDCYFPMFVSRTSLEREKDHIEGFAPEVAWVTRAGETELEVPVAIRPTSETVMYPYYAKWIRSHRDLPVRLNMWNNVIRWEFSHPTPFIRTREFLWQEGHCAWAKESECAQEVLDVLSHYAAVYEQLLAVPVVKGKKTEKEKFAGGYYTTTVETYIEAVGRGCQGATSHNLGQNFGKMFNITFQDPEKNDGSTLIPWQNSWGLSTRVIGVMIMIHGDNQGMVMPPRVASVQVVVIPVGITKNTTEETRKALLDSCLALEAELRRGGIRAKTDLRDNYSPGWRFNHWEVKGVPVRVEMGPKELQSNELALAIRCNGEKRLMARDGQMVENMHRLMDEIHEQMLHRAAESRSTHTKQITKWGDFVPALNNKCLLLAPWCGAMDCEDKIKKDSGDESKALQSAETREDSRAPSMGAKTLCIPFDQPGPVDGLHCICKGCTAPAIQWVLFGRSY